MPNYGKALKKEKSHALTALVILLCVLLLNGCGFHLRSVGSKFKLIDSIRIVASSSYQGFSSILTQTFRKADIASQLTSPYRLVIEKELFNKRVAMVTEKVRASEYEVSLVIIYSFAVDRFAEENEKRESKMLIQSQRIQLSRSFVYDISRVNAMQKEEQLIQEEMRQEAAFRILHHVQSVSDTFGLQEYSLKKQQQQTPTRSATTTKMLLSHE